MPETDAWDVLGDATRRSIVERLAERPCPVGELAAGLPVSRPAVSQHLKVLKDAGMVSELRDGTRRVYRLEPAGVSALRDQLDTFWRRALAGFADLVDETHETDETGSITGPDSPTGTTSTTDTDHHRATRQRDPDRPHRETP